MIHPVRMWSHVSRSLKFWPISIGMEALRIGIQPDLALVSKKGIHSQHGGSATFIRVCLNMGEKLPMAIGQMMIHKWISGFSPCFLRFFFKNLGFYLVFSHVFPVVSPFLVRARPHRARHGHGTMPNATKPSEGGTGRHRKSGVPRFWLHTWRKASQRWARSSCPKFGTEQISPEKVG